MTGNFIHDIIDEEIAEGKYSYGDIMTRFPPEPNGYIHIGHVKALYINFSTAEKYGGKCNLRFDDTNPAKEDVEYVEAIKDDIRWLGFNGQAPRRFVIFRHVLRACREAYPRQKGVCVRS